MSTPISYGAVSRQVDLRSSALGPDWKKISDVLQEAAARKIPRFPDAPVVNYSFFRSEIHRAKICKVCVEDWDL